MISKDICDLINFTLVSPNCLIFNVLYDFEKKWPDNMHDPQNMTPNLFPLAFPSDQIST